MTTPQLFKLVVIYGNPSLVPEAAQGSANVVVANDGETWDDLYTRAFAGIDGDKMIVRNIIRQGPGEMDYEVVVIPVPADMPTVTYVESTHFQDDPAKYTEEAAATPGQDLKRRPEYVMSGYTFFNKDSVPHDLRISPLVRVDTLGDEPADTHGTNVYEIITDPIRMLQTSEALRKNYGPVLSNNRPLIIYTPGRVDSFAAAWACGLHLGFENCDFLTMGYDSPVPDGIDGRAVMMVGMAVGGDRLDQFIKRTGGYTVIAANPGMHQELVDKYEEQIKLRGEDNTFHYHTIPGNSACVIAWMVMSMEYSEGIDASNVTDNIPALLRYIEDRALMTNRFQESDYIYEALRDSEYIHGQKWDEFTALMVSEGGGADLIYAGRLIKDTKQRLAQDILMRSSLMLVPEEGAEIAVVNMPMELVTMAGQLMFQAYPDLKLLVTYEERGGKHTSKMEDYVPTFVIDMRSNANHKYTAMWIATALGGGGHTHAAGFVTSAKSIVDILEKITDTMLLEHK